MSTRESTPKTQGPSAARRKAERASKRAASGLRGLPALSGLSCFALIAGALFAPSAFVADSPGPLFNVLGEHQNEQIISVDGKDSKVRSGELNMTTVSVAGGPYTQMTGIEAITSWLHQAPNGTGYDQRVVPTEALYPHVSSEEAQSASGAQMADSQTQAQVAAARYMNMPVTEKAMVAGIRSGSPAEGKLGVRDRILRVGDTEITSLTEVSSAVQASEGKEITVRVQRGEEQKDFKLTPVQMTGKNSAGEDITRWVIGVELAQEYDLPFKTTYSLDGIGGPSAGLMLTLGTIQKVGDKNLLLPDGTEGNKNIIAGTGTINAEGKVGPIGGIRFKIRASAAHGVPYFLAPKGNCDEVKSVAKRDPQALTYFVDGKAAGQIRVIPVETVSDAVTALDAIREGNVDSLPTCG